MSLEEYAYYVNKLRQNFAWKHEYDVKIGRHKQHTPNANDHHMPLNVTPLPWKFPVYATGHLPPLRMLLVPISWKLELTDNFKTNFRIPRSKISKRRLLLSQKEISYWPIAIALVEDKKTDPIICFETAFWIRIV